MTEQEPEHSQFSPSGSGKWLVCHGSIPLEKSLNIKSISNIYAREGTLCHKLSSECLISGREPITFLNEVHGEFTVNHEMVSSMQMYVDHCNKYKLFGHRWLVEKKIDLSFLYPKMKGTGDFVAESSDTLHVMDLKYGRGVPVVVERNTQEMLYAMGQLQDIYLRLGTFKHIKKVFIHIIQPRCETSKEVSHDRLELLEGDRIRIWETSVEEIREFSLVVKIAIADALSEFPSFNPGEHQCKWCPCAPHCKHLAEWSTQQAKIEFFDLLEENFTPIPVGTISDDEKAKILENWPAVENWIKNIRGYAMSQLQRGNEFPHHKLVRGRSNRKWVDEEVTKNKLKSMGYTREEVYHPRKMISPSQADALTGKKKIQLNKFWIKPQGKISMAHETDKREALTPTQTAKDDFAEFIEDDE